MLERRDRAANQTGPRLAVGAPVEVDRRNLKGHRLMVQVQSTWFPVIDRNPQKFVPSIYAAKAEDFVTATQRVYTSRERASHIVLPVVR